MEQTAFNSKLLYKSREKLGLSRNDIIIKLGQLGLEITQPTLANWEEGKTSPDAKDLPALAQVLGVKVRDFYNGR